MSMKNNIKLLDIGTRLVASGIFGYSAFMKFSSAPTAVYIFQRIGMESAGRYGVAVLECITILLLLVPKMAWRGALLGMVLMLGAIVVHIITNEFDVSRTRTAGQFVAVVFSDHRGVGYRRFAPGKAYKCGWYGA